MPRRTTDLIRLRVRLRSVSRSFALILTGLVICCLPVTVSADGLNARSLVLGSSSASVTTDYTFSFTITTASTLGSMQILFCSNSPLQDDGCELPAGLDVTHAQFTAISGLSSVDLFPAATNELVLTWGPTVIVPPHPVSFALSGIINPSASGSYYARLSTYASGNVTGPVVDYGGLAFAINTNLEISSYVPPYLTFCSGVSIPTFDCASATGDYINLGGLSAAHSSQGTSQLLVATNAADGYTIQVYGTTLISGNNVIAGLSTNAGSRPGQPQFGFNLRSNAVPRVGADPMGPGSGQPAAGYGTPNSYRFDSNDIVASSQNADDWRRYTVSYLVNVPAGQALGVYAATLTYVGAGSF